MLAAGSLPAATSARAPDIPVGTHSAEVIRLHGWPKGKGVKEAGGRENWLYTNFQVRLQNDRVVSVDYIAPEAPMRTRSPTPPPGRNADPSPPTPTRSPSPTGSLPSATVIPSSTKPAVRKAPDSPPRRPSSSAAIQPQDTIQLSPQRLPAPARKIDGATRPSTDRFWVSFGAVFIAASSVIGLGFLMARRRTAEVAASSLPPSPWAPRQDWKESVAQQLDRANRRESLPPGLSEPPPLARKPEISIREAPESVVELSYTILDQLEWKRFELVVQRFYAATGHHAEFTKSGADGGVDIYLYRSGQKRPFSYVQCKAWGPRKIDVGTVRELRGVMASEGVTEGVLATTGEFTAEAGLFCSKNSIAALTGPTFVAKFNALTPSDRRRILAEVLNGDYTTPSCPQCERKMIWRENGGFWSCATFRKCGSKPIHPRKARNFGMTLSG